MAKQKLPTRKELNNKLEVYEATTVALLQIMDTFVLEDVEREENTGKYKSKKEYQALIDSVRLSMSLSLDSVNIGEMIENSMKIKTSHKAFGGNK